MAQNLVVTPVNNPFLDANIPYSLVLDWTAAGAGTVSLGVVAKYVTQLALLSANPIVPIMVQGRLRSVETIPGANGDLTTNLPTGAYNLTLLDKYGFDILNGSATGTNARSATVAEKILPIASTIILNSEITLTIDSAGDGAKGRIVIELEDLGWIKL